jgi:hypothetical protein
MTAVLTDIDLSLRDTLSREWVLFPDAHFEDSLVDEIEQLSRVVFELFDGVQSLVEDWTGD